MKTIGIFEAKTKLSEVCEEVAVSHEPVTVTRRGKPLVRIIPIESAPTTIVERRSVYMAAHDGQEADDEPEFEINSSREISKFDLQD